MDGTIYLYSERYHIIEYEDGTIEQSKKTLKTQVYAMISRNILSDDGFYPVIHQVDTTFKKAFEVLEENRDLMEYSGSPEL